MESASVGYGLFLGNLKGYIEEGRDERHTWWRSWAGLNLISVDESDVRGARVVHVLPDTPAAAAGLEPGDIITAADARPVCSHPDLSLILARMAPGEQVGLAVRRGGNRLTVTLTLAERPSAPAPAEEARP